MRWKLGLFAIACALWIFSCASTSPPIAGDPGKPYPESAYAYSGGLRIHYRLFEPKGTLRGNILLVHGFGASTFSFRYNIPFLVEEGWRVVAVDIPPFGYSDKSRAIKDLGIDRGRLFWPILDGISGEPWVLACHSMGGLFITAMAEERPASVRALVYIDGAVSLAVLADPGPFRGFISAFTSALIADRAKVKLLLDMAFEAPVGEDVVEGYMAPFAIPGGVEALLDYSQALSRSPPADPRGIKVPTLILWGSKDIVISPGEGLKLRDSIEGSTLKVIDGAGHCPHESRSAELNAALGEFLAIL